MIWSLEVLHWVQLRSLNGRGIAAISQLLAKCLIFTAHFQLPLTKYCSIQQDITVANHHCMVPKFAAENKTCTFNPAPVGRFSEAFLFPGLLWFLNISKSFAASFPLKQRRRVKRLPAAWASCCTRPCTKDEVVSVLRFYWGFIVLWNGRFGLQSVRQHG